MLKNIPEGWQIVEFNEVAELKHGYQFRNYDFTKEGIKIFKITQIKGDGKYNISNCSFIDEVRLNKFEKFIIRKGDILIALTGATIGKTARFNSNEIVLQNYRVGNFFPIDENILSKDFFYHFLNSNFFFHQILARQTQSAQQNIGKDEINNMQVILPKIKEQKAVANILSALDDKIELNLQMNKTLEKMAMALYKHWFVDFGPFQDGAFVDSELGEIPEGWEVKSLSEITQKIGSGSTPRGGKSVYIDSGPCLIRSQNIHDFEFRWKGLVHIKDDAAKKLKNVRVEENDVLINITGDSILRTTVVDKSALPAYVNQHVAIIRPMESN